VVVAAAEKEKTYQYTKDLIHSQLRKKKKPFIFNLMKRINDHSWFYLPYSLLLLVGPLLRPVR
jgi:hypothetical protein